MRLSARGPDGLGMVMLLGLKDMLEQAEKRRGIKSEKGHVNKWKNCWEGEHATGKTVNCSSNVSRA